MTRATAQTCTHCPDESTATAIGVGFSILVNRGGQLVDVSGSAVGACERLILAANLSYNRFGPGGAVGAGFTAGTGHIILPNGTSVNVTPGDLATTIIGPTVSIPGVLTACTAPAGTTLVDFKDMNTLNYTLTPADVAAGTAFFTFEYTNGLSQLPNVQGNCILTVRASPQQSVQIAPLPTCSIQPPSQTVCVGGNATFTATTTGTGPFTFAWRKGCPGAGPVLSTNSTLTITNAQLGDAGCYQLTVTDRFGCVTTCQANLIVNPNPTCTITGTDLIICPPANTRSTNVYTSTVLPAGGTVTHNWSISGSACATIQGPTTGASVTVVVDHSQCIGGSFTLTDNVTRDGCPGQCTKTVRIDCPSIRVWKQVVCYTNGVCEPFNADLDTQKSAAGVRLDPPNAANCPAFCYRITVRNTGSLPLTLTVSDPDLDLSACGFPPVLAAGATVQCVVPAVTRCANEQNIVTASGVTDQNTTVVARDTNNVTVTPIAVACVLDVSTDGGATFFNPGPNCARVDIPNSYIVRLRVSNTGQYALQNVTVTTTGLPMCFASPLNLGTLAVGESRTNQCTFNCTRVLTNTYSVSVVAEASESAGHICDFNAQGQPILARSTCETCVICVERPSIRVWKQVVCYTNGLCEPFNPDLDTQKSAAGVRLDPPNAANCPAFCYRITVRNTGNVPLTLTVSDPDLNLTACGFPPVLAVGATAQCIVPAVTRCANEQNIVTASGVTDQNTTVVARDTNNVTVTPIAVACVLDVSTDGGATFFNPGPNCARVLIPDSYIVRLRVSNTGQYALQNVTVTTTGLPMCFASPLNLGDLAVGQTRTNQCTFSCTRVLTNTYSVSVVAEASESAGHICDFNAQGQPILARSSCETCVICVEQPSIRVWKQVVCYTNGVCEPFNADLNTQKSAAGVRLEPPNAANCPAFCYRITVRNTGNVPLTLTVSDPDLDLTACGFPPVLAVGATAQCIVPAVTRCANEQNIVTARGVTDQNTTVVARDTNNVTVTPIAVVCDLLVSTNGGASFFNPGAVCPQVVIGNSYIVRISVSNPGQYALQNVTVTSVTGLGGCLPSPLNLGSLAINETKTRDCTFTCTQPGRNNYSVSVVAEASESAGHICDFNVQGQRILARSQCQTCVECFGRPGIQVYKQVLCVNGSGTCDPFSPDLNTQKTASGVKNGECPAFCYRITVINTSDPGIELRNLRISDNSIPDPDLNLAACGFPSTLAAPGLPGDRASCIVPAVPHCQDTRDVVTANADGVSATSGTFIAVVTDRDTNDVRVLNINIVCESSLFSSMDLLDVTCNGSGQNTANDCTLVLPPDFNGPVQYTVTLRNTGTSPLDVTSLNGLPALTDCGSGAPLVVALPIRIAAGGSYTIQGCFNVAGCPTNFGINVTAHAEASDENGTLCVYDRNGRRISDDSSPNDCVCTICCFVQPEIECRVTGGGVLLPGTFDTSCIRVDTTIFPMQIPGNLTVRKVTHGGQLGAPFSQRDCGEELGNPCIRGQWSHTRHYEGKGNPREVIDMSFHSATPKGVYDSLLCACLGCCDPESGAFITPIIVGGICNPDDHKICGPQPRPAPANAIIWSGIGRITPEDDVAGPRAARSEWVVFRIYIEDRSEPGGFHPGGAVEPADIYCFQAWKTGLRVSRKPDFTTVATEFRRRLGQANCDFLAALEAGTLPIGTLPSPLVDGVAADIQDCGPMSTGNHQIHPATGATCNK